MKREIAEKILKETEAGYDLISTKFSQTRKHFWRGLEFLKDYTHQGGRVFDFGCGNGRLLELIGDIENIEYHGADVSQKLIDIAKERYVTANANFLKISPSQGTLPLESEFFNTAYSIAVFHHFPSKEYRERMARELYRVTKKDGYVVITVWNLWPTPASLWRGKQKKYFKNILKNWSVKVRGLFGGSTSKREVKPPQVQLDWNDCMISFTDNSGVKFERFHHAFTKRELKRLFKDAGFKIERCEVIDGRNIVLVGKK